jgi:AcrR family transcriptional regulator
MESEQTSTARRGRPARSDVVAATHPGLPIRDPLQSLPPAARWVLQSARRILVEQGFPALTMENIALESKESRMSIQRYFGSKSGLIEVLFDSLVHDTYAALKAETESLPPGEGRIHTYLRGLYAIVGDIDATRGFFEIAPHALRDPDLRRRFARLYVWHRELTSSTCGLDDIPLSEQKRAALSAMILATIDGLAYQVALDPDAVDVNAVFELLFGFIHDALKSEPAAAPAETTAVTWDSAPDSAPDPAPDPAPDSAPDPAPRTWS